MESSTTTGPANQSISRADFRGNGTKFIATGGTTRDYKSLHLPIERASKAMMGEHEEESEQIPTPRWPWPPVGMLPPPAEKRDSELNSSANMLT